MSNERETKTVNVAGHEVVMYTYITGREARNIESTLMDKLEMKQKGGEQEISGFKGSMLTERQDMQIKAVIVSVDGKTDDVVGAVLDLPSKESEEIMTYVKELTESKKSEAGNEKA